jgi:hypothetical protein
MESVTTLNQPGKAPERGGIVSRVCVLAVRIEGHAC